MNDKTKAIIAHITIIGWLAALALYFFTEKTSLTRFYLRQVLGLLLIGMLINWLPLMGLGFPLSIGVLVLIIMSLLGAIKSEERETPFIGKYFQKWFNFI